MQGLSKEVELQVFIEPPHEDGARKGEAPVLPEVHQEVCHPIQAKAAPESGPLEHQALSLWHLQQPLRSLKGESVLQRRVYTNFLLPCNRNDGITNSPSFLFPGLCHSCRYKA